MIREKYKDNKLLAAPDDNDNFQINLNTGISVTVYVKA